MTLSLAVWRLLLRFLTLRIASQCYNSHDRRHALSKKDLLQLRNTVVRMRPRYLKCVLAEAAWAHLSCLFMSASCACVSCAGPLCGRSLGVVLAISSARRLRFATQTPLCLLHTLAASPELASDTSNRSEWAKRRGFITRGVFITRMKDIH